MFSRQISQKSKIDIPELILVLPHSMFPIIDTPVFVNKEKGLKMFLNTEPVMIVEIN